MRGIQGPQQPLQKIIFSLPEWRRITSILGDLNEDLPEEDIVCRKVDTINAWVDYAWKIKPKEPKDRKAQAPPIEIAKQPKTLQAILKVPGHERTIAPKPWYASMIQDPISPSAIPPDSTVAQEPPPPYAAVDNSRFSNASIPGANRTGALPASGRPAP